MWQPISEEKIYEFINDAERAMKPQVRNLWEKIKIPPQKWQQSPMGDLGGGFWVIALIGQTCIYYNDIEDGFNQSEYDQYGLIKDYYCNQTNLLEYLNWLTADLTNGYL